MRRRAAVAAAALLLAAAAAALSPSCAGKRSAVILISVDTLRADHLGAYGYGAGTSPNLDAFAADALLFERCFSHAPVTGSSLASLLSGFLPHETQVFENLPLPEGVETLAEILQGEGYATLGVMSNFMLRRGGGWEQGFDVYDSTMTAREAVRGLPERIAEHTTDRAIELLKQHGKENLFLWVHYQDPHGPYTPPPSRVIERGGERQPLPVNGSLSGRGGIPSYQYLGDDDYHYYVDRYDGEIRYFDEHLGRLLEAIREEGLYEDSLIVFTADHGEGMGENRYYFAHGENLSTALTHVPLVIRHGSRLSGRNGSWVQHLDVLPTVLGILGMKADSRLRGLDLRDPLPRGREIFGEMKSPLRRDGRKFSLLRDGLKLEYTPLTDSYRLFNLEEDFSEGRNLMAVEGEAPDSQPLAEGLQRIRREDLLALDITNRPRPVTEETREKMRSLGYIQ